MKVSALFRKIESLQGDVPWGHVLDAGTGPRSLAWVASLDTERWTAVTAQHAMAQSAGAALPGEPRDNDRMILGNWSDDSLLAGEQFDTVLLDYFVGAIEAFAPYDQEAVLRRMVSLTRGRLYITGLEPYVPVVVEDEIGRFVGDLGRLRDACMLLAGDRPYREYPAAWVVDQLRRCGLNVTETKHFSIRYRSKFLESQLSICEDRVKRLPDQTLASAMKGHIANIRAVGEALIEKHDGLPYGRDYVICAE